MNGGNSSDPHPAALWVAKKVFAAADAGDVESLRGLVHPTAAAEFLTDHLLSLQLAGSLPQDMGPTISHTRHYLDRVFGVNSIMELEALGPHEAVARYLRHTWGEANADAAVVGTRTFLGVVPETSEEVHVLFKLVRAGARPIVDVLTLRTSDSGWKTMLNGGLLTQGSLGFAVAFS